MRRVLVSLGVLMALSPLAAAQSPGAAMAPASFEWGDHSRTFSHFFVNITNAGAADAFTITSITLDPVPRDAHGVALPTPTVYSPTPTLPLPAGATGTFHVWVGGLDQPPPAGAAPGEYRVDVRIASTIDPNRTATSSARIQRSVPAEPENGTIEGRVLDSSTQQPPTGRIQVAASDPTSVRRRPANVTTTATDADGRFRLTLPAGHYWLRVEGAAYETAFLRDLELAPGGTLSLAPSLIPAAQTRILDTPERTPDFGAPTYRMAADANLRITAVLSDSSAATSERGLGLYLSDGSQRWRTGLPARAGLPLELAQWPNDEGGLDVSVDGRLVAVGTDAGTVSVYETGSTTPKWTFTGLAEQNPLVPGPFGHGSLRVGEVRFAPDVQLLVAGTLTGFVHAFDPETGAVRWTANTAGQVRALRFTTGSESLWVGSGDNHLYRLHPETGATLDSAELTAFPWEHIGVSGDGKRVVTGGVDGVLRVFDERAQPVWSRTLPGPIVGFDVAPGGQPVVAMTADGVYAYNRNGLLQWYRGESGGAGRLSISLSSRFIAYGKESAGADEPSARILALDGTPVWEFRAGADPETVRSVVLRDDGELAAANGASGKLYFFKEWQKAPPTGTDGGPGGRGGSPGPGMAGVLVAVAWVFVVVARRRRDP